ncbi:unnamed protein product [Adineta steineri]|uniref:Uncharacterized protein n=1 Tax=Adineta steineri TaxID=433720 RepID=A0A815PRY1_9BILA|nr:unnamed protein product [Adineta steineri]
MHNDTQIIKYSTYNKFTILPPLFHQIWVKVTGKTGFPLSEINSCKVLHSGMTTELIGDKMHNVHWQYKLWNNMDLEELFMFNSTGNKPIIFSNSSDNNNSPAQYLKQFIIKHLRTFHNASEKDKNFYDTISISEEQKYTKLANIMYKKFQLKQSIQSLSSQNSINKRLLLMLTDLFRIFVLFIFGGIYADADTYCMKSFYPLLSIPPYLYVINKSTSINKIHDDVGEVFTNFAAYESENQRGKLIGYSILGSIPNSEILFRLVTEYLVTEPHYSEYKDNNVPSWISTGPKLITDYIDLLTMQKQYSFFRIYPSHLFYPVHYSDQQIINSFQRNKTIVLNYIRTKHPHSFSIQLFGSTVQMV